MKHVLSSRFLWAGVLLLSSSLASAGITLGGTRVVLKAPSKEGAILVKNQAPQDVMIQSWIEAEDSESAQDVPFVITPPLSRLGANKQQTLRILFQGQGLPTDRESVFRLNVQEIPQKPKSENNLQIAIRQRIKVFYRPNGLPGSAAEAPKSLEWRLVRESKKAALEVSNNSAFYISLSGAALKAGGKSYPIETNMIAPKSRQTFYVKGFSGGGTSGMKVEFETINDYGGVDNNSSSLGGG